MLNNTQSIQLPSISTPGPLCNSPTRGFHLCVHCGSTSARVIAHKWKEHHPVGTLVYGLLPEQHPKAQSDNLHWRLLCWVCDNCMRMWSSYKYYVALEEVPLCSNDFNPLPSEIFKALPATPPTDGENSMADAASTLSDISYPSRSSSRAWSTSQSTTSPLDNAGLHPTLFPGHSVAMDFAMVPIPPASAAASAALSGDYSDLLLFSNPQTKHVSAPQFTVEQLAYLDEVAAKRWSEPVNMDQIPLIPDPLNPDRAKAHKRGNKFDQPNYVHMRIIGACQDCRAKRRKCHPDHPRMDIQPSPGSQ